MMIDPEKRRKLLAARSKGKRGGYRCVSTEQRSQGGKKRMAGVTKEERRAWAAKAALTRQMKAEHRD